MSIIYHNIKDWRLAVLNIQSKKDAKKHLREQVKYKFIKAGILYEMNKEDGIIRKVIDKGLN